MISARLGHASDRLLGGIARRLDINPNIITFLGFLITALAGVVLSRNLLLGGMLIIVGGFFDILDGAIARTNKRVTAFGAFLDSVLDRYADAFLFLGAAWYLKNNLIGVSLSIGTLVGALLISYTRARAEGLGLECKVGIMERPERVILLVFGALSGWLLEVLWIMFPLTHITALQRVFHVRKTSKGIK